jgi:hypothetical protein
MRRQRRQARLLVRREALHRHGFRRAMHSHIRHRREPVHDLREITNQSTTDQAIIAREHTPHLVEEQLSRHATPRREALLEPKDERAEIPPRKELHPEYPRISEHHEQGVAQAPRQFAVRKVDLGLVSRRRFEANHRRRDRCGAQGPHVIPHLGMAAGVAHGANLHE